MEIKVTLDGLDAVLRRAGSKAKDVARAGAAQLVREAEAVMAESKRQAPVDTGALRASGHVQTTKSANGDVMVTLGYGGAAAPYALHVHEDLDAHHPVGRAKFLEGPLREAEPRIARTLHAAMSAALERDV